MAIVWDDLQLAVSIGPMYAILREVLSRVTVSVCRVLWRDFVGRSLISRHTLYICLSISSVPHAPCVKSPSWCCENVQQRELHHPALAVTALLYGEVEQRNTGRALFDATRASHSHATWIHDCSHDCYYTSLRSSRLILPPGESRGEACSGQGRENSLGVELQPLSWDGPPFD